MRKGTLLMGCLVLAAGCAGLGTRLETPEVTFVGIRAVEANLFEQKLEVRLRVLNPNTIELPVNGLDMDVELAGEPFATGVTAREKLGLLRSIPFEESGTLPIGDLTGKRKKPD